MPAVNTTSVTPPTPEPRAGFLARLAQAWLAICGLVVVVWAPSLGWRGLAKIPGDVSVAWRAVAESGTERIERSSGITPQLVAAIRDAMPADGRLVLYSPYGGKEFELDGADPRGEPARQVRVLFERVKNLLYPTPRDVRFARDSAELLTQVDANLAGRLLVVDGTQGPGELTVGGRYELVYEAPGRIPQLRVWRLRRPE